jgi:nickel transport protein
MNGLQNWLARLALMAAACGLAAPAQAHGIWFAQRSGEMALVYGEGAEDLDMVKRLPLVREVRGFDAAGQSVPVKVNAEGKLAVIAGRAQILAAVLDNGIWSKNKAGKWFKQPKGEVAEVVHSSHNLKYAVHLTGDVAVPALPGQTLQLQPLAAQLPRQRGEVMKLRVLFEGKPLAGVKIVADFVNDPDAEPLISDAQGRVDVPVRNQGLNVIAATAARPASDPALTDHVEHLATLSFRLAHAPE